MSLRGKFWEWLDRGLTRSRKQGKRGFAAAANDRLTNDWPTTSSSINYDLRYDLVTLRARARKLTQDDAYSKRFMTLVKMNVPGPNGFKFQSNVKENDGRQDRLANVKIEEAFARWSRRDLCTVTGQLSFRQVQHLLMVHVARDGEFLVRKVIDKRSPFGLKLQLLESDLLDETLNRRNADGSFVIGGIEFDSWRRPIAYHIKQYDPALEVMTTSAYGRETKRIPAEEIYHGFDIERAFQARGFSWVTPSMMRLKMLSGLEDAALVAARVGAAQMGFYSPSVDNATEYQGSDKDASGNVIQDVEPGMIAQLPPGSEFHQFDAKYPSEAHESFSKNALRGIAAGLGVAYSSLSGDLRDVNYSSIRAGLIEEREVWKTIQAWFVESFLEPVFTDWLESAITFGGLTLPMAKFEKFNHPVFVGRRWSWVDPEKDINAAIKEIDAGLSTRTQYLAEKGEAIEDVFQELADEEAQAEALGLEFGEEKQPEPAPEEPSKEEKKVDEVQRELGVMANNLLAWRDEARKTAGEIFAKAAEREAPAPVVNVPVTVTPDTSKGKPVEVRRVSELIRDERGRITGIVTTVDSVRTADIVGPQGETIHITREVAVGSNGHG